MADPVRALLLFAIVAVVMAAMFWPRRGVVARVRRLMGLSERVRMEDALKHLHNSEYAGRRATIESLAGSLEISRAHAARIATQLEHLRFARSQARDLTLTDAGRAYALRILRTHRLWERYLADRTGVAPARWHDDAEYWEHRLSPEAAERLAAGMGQPLYDPHGDPIPTADGDLPPRGGVALTALPVGSFARVVHLEDEPQEVYDEILRTGLALQMVLHLVERSPDRIVFEYEGERRVIPPVVAANVTVESVSAAAYEDEGRESASVLRPGERATVVGLASNCQGPQRRRLLDLGVVPGTTITAELASAALDPVAYRIRGALIALRRQQAAWILIDRPETRN